MQPKPDEDGDPAKCLSAGSSKHMPLPHPADVRERVHVRTHFTHKFYSVIQLVRLMDLGRRRVERAAALFRLTQGHSPPSEVRGML